MGAGLAAAVLRVPVMRAVLEGPATATAQALLDVVGYATLLAVDSIWALLTCHRRHTASASLNAVFRTSLKQFSGG